MDEETAKKLMKEIEDLNKVSDSGQNLDSVDGFKDYVRKQLHNICGKPIAASSSHSATSDFHENRTALVTSEARYRGQGDQGDDVYNFSHAERGLAVVINNEDFSLSQDFGDRPGSSYDAASLYRTFKNLGFRVLVKENLSRSQMVDLLKLVKDEYDHKNADCFVCAILSHGDETREIRENEKSAVRQDLLFGVDGKAVATKIIVEFFNDDFCPGLRGKPRLFFFQACRGSKYDPGIDVTVSAPVSFPGISDHRGHGEGTDHRDSCVDKSEKPGTKRQKSLSSSVDPPEYDHLYNDNTDAKPAGSVADDRRAGSSFSAPRSLRQEADRGKISQAQVRNVPISPTPLYKDCLIMYATPPGYYAWRRKTGAWFVQSLCKVLDSPQIGQISLQNALVRALGLVAFDYQSENPSRLEMHQKKESPVIESMLVKDVFFIKK